MGTLRCCACSNNLLITASQKPLLFQLGFSCALHTEEDSYTLSDHRGGFSSTMACSYVKVPNLPFNATVSLTFPRPEGEFKTVMGESEKRGHMICPRSTTIGSSGHPHIPPPLHQHALKDQLAWVLLIHVD
uniref:Uncharacterized protein n=1 Tax=Trypanosoma congolense (strain IL3000) TaxID=1068625 RepID=G0UQ03_TRYCI|nr:hypothetical protein, unlikely [Trypanosoma congolense IL3000]